MIDRGLQRIVRFPAREVVSLHDQLEFYRSQEVRKNRQRLGSVEYNAIISETQTHIDFIIDESYDDISSAALQSTDVSESEDECEHNDEMNTSMEMENSVRDEIPSNGVESNLNSLRVGGTGEVHKWPRGTTLIAGDSILNNLQENRMGRSKCVKVRAFPGAKIEDMYDYMTPLLKKEPNTIILHAGSNNSTLDDAPTIVNKLLLLKSHIRSILPNCTVCLSTPTLRLENPSAGFVLRQVSDMIKQLDIEMVDYDDINASFVGRAGLHLNMKGAGKLATNFINAMKCL